MARSSATPQRGLLVLGDMSIHGSVKPVRLLTEPLVGIPVQKDSGSWLLGRVVPKVALVGEVGRDVAQSERTDRAARSPRSDMGVRGCQDDRWAERAYLAPLPLDPPRITRFRPSRLGSPPRAFHTVPSRGAPL